MPARRRIDTTMGITKSKCNKPVKRLWISSLTEDAIKEGFASLKPAEDYKNLYLAGNASCYR
jgi:DNA topoisomerase-3